MVLGEYGGIVFDCVYAYMEPPPRSLTHHQQTTTTTHTSTKTNRYLDRYHVKHMGLKPLLTSGVEIFQENASPRSLSYLLCIPVCIVGVYMCGCVCWCDALGVEVFQEKARRLWAVCCVVSIVYVCAYVCGRLVDPAHHDHLTDQT